MNNDNNSNRRKLLIGLGTGLVGATQLPRKWSKPVVDSVLLPAHAETTSTDSEPEAPVAPSKFYGRFSLVDDPTALGNSSPANKLLSVIISDAFAGLAVSEGEMCIDTSAAPAFSAEVVLSDGVEDGLYSTTSGVLDGGPVVLSFVSGTCDFNQTRVELEVATPTSSGAPYTIRAAAGARYAQSTLPEGTSCPMKPSCIKT